MRRQYQPISLQTGSFDAFKSARNLYRKFGFIHCGPFTAYADNKHSGVVTIDFINQGWPDYVGQTKISDRYDYKNARAIKDPRKVLAEA